MYRFPSLGSWLLACLTLWSCTRAGFGVDALTDDAVAGDASGAVADGLTSQLDARRDLAPTGPDGDLDLPTLVCAPNPQVVGSPLPGFDLVEPAVRLDGLRVVARRRVVSEIYTSTRATLTGSFGPWALTKLFPARTEDPSFFLEGNEEIAITARFLGSGPRILQLCSGLPATACAPLSVSDVVTGQSIAKDMDGPAVFRIAGELFMLFNVSDANLAATVDVYLAQLAPFSGVPPLTEWVGRPVAALALPGIGEDDPAISADGSVIVVARKDGVDTNLWVSFSTPSTTEVFSAPVPLAGLNTDAAEGGPALFTLPGGQLELFFSSNRSGSSQIYRTLCTR